jgi:hypothetical protein
MPEIRYRLILIESEQSGKVLLRESRMRIHIVGETLEHFGVHSSSLFLFPLRLRVKLFSRI